MSNKAVFVDRDNTLIEDPGYISDPSVVKLLPGVELALKSLAASGYKAVVVTNQAGVARGLITEEQLERIHAEIRRQLADKGAHLDAIYYCPYHPEGTVEGYAVESDLRKPHPGMILQAAKELDIDLSASWMVGDSPRDIEAGQRAGCWTIRVRLPTQQVPLEEDEDVQADFVVRNLVDAARVILREQGRVRAAVPVEGKAEIPPAVTAPPGELPSIAEAAQAAETAPQAPPDATETTGMPEPQQQAPAASDGTILREILSHVRQIARAGAVEEFSLTKLLAGVIQILAVLALVVVFWRMLSNSPETATWAMIAMVLQVMALTFFMMHRAK